MWPKISNIDTTIESTIKRYANDNLAASGLNAWVRIYSGANAGLILESNTNFKIFTAAGEAGSSIYGNSQLSGTVGRTWGNGIVSTDAGRVLRPSPIVTTLNSKEGQDQISRTCEFSITCFSLQQLEIIQNYFMEPGYSVGVEWGWNTGNSALGLISTNAGAAGILNGIADTTLNNTALNSKRILTNGEYDVFLGFIVGSTVSSDGENFKVDVKLRGSPSLPTYLQTQNKITDSANGKAAVDGEKSTELYGESELSKEGPENSRDRRFKFMFNELPAQKQTNEVKNLLTEADYKDFINFDKLDYKKIDEFLQASGPGTLDFFTSDTINLPVGGGVSLEIEKEKLFSKNRYIRVGLAAKILNAIGSLDKYTIGNKTVSLKINIDNSIIGSFPRMFSTKASKLVVPGFIPDFLSVYFLSSDPILQENTGKLNGISATKYVKFTTFHEPGALDANGLKEQSGDYWGYLKNLYVNFDLFKEKLEQTNKNIREVFLDILNEMSSAVNSFWNFQIVEGEDADGNIEITVIDENWIGQNPNDGAATVFKHSGVGSPFLNASLDISIPAEMAGKIINQRLDKDSQTDLNPIKVGFVFEEKTDLFLDKVSQAGGFGTSGTAGASGTSGGVTDAGASDLEKNKKRLAELRARLEPQITGITPNVNDDTGLTVYRNKDGDTIYSIRTETGELAWVGPGAITSTFTKADQTEINNLVTTIKTQATEAAQAAVTANLEKIDVVPAPVAVLDTLPLENFIAEIDKRFTSFCLDDTDYLEKIRNYYMDIKNGGLSQPLPIKYSFTILGNSGIRRGDTFKIDGIPSKYAERGIFQVTGVEHSLSGMRWETTVESIYRQTE